MAWFLESWRCQSNRVRDCIKFKKKMMKKQASRRGKEFGPPINQKRQCLLVYCCAAAVSLCLALPLMTSDEIGTDMNHIQSVVKYCQSLGSSYALLNGFLCRFRKFPGLILSRFLLYFTILHIICLFTFCFGPFFPSLSRSVADFRSILSHYNFQRSLPHRACKMLFVHYHIYAYLDIPYSTANMQII